MNETIEYFQDIQEDIETIETREELADVLSSLLLGYRDGLLGETSVVDYLKSIRAFIAGLDRWAEEHELPAPRQPTWRWLGRIVYGAFGRD